VNPAVPNQSFIPSFLPSPYSTVTSWLADDSMVLAARSGISTSPAIYSELDPRMTSAPSNLMVAYEQAVYFIALAARRAMREKLPTTSLFSSLAQVEAEANAVSEGATWLCTIAGVGCPAGGAGLVLEHAATAIEGSGLGVDDVVQLTSILRRNKWSFQLRRALPVLASGLLGIGVGVWWWRSRQS